LNGLMENDQGRWYRTEEETCCNVGACSWIETW